MRRLLAGLFVVLALGFVCPPSALAVENIWKGWAEGIKTRSKIEMPFAVLVTLPPMIVTTPFWAGGLAFSKMKGDD